jgi:hypothetical protein
VLQKLLQQLWNHRQAGKLQNLFKKVVIHGPGPLDPDTKKLQNTIEHPQAQNELLKHENQGLRETVKLEKKRRQRSKPLRDYLFDRDNPNAAQVFSPTKIQLAREQKAEIEAQQEAQALQKQLEKEQREEAARERKAMQEAKRVEKAEAKRLRDEAKKQKDLEKEDRNAQRLANRQLHSDSKAQKQQNRGGVAMATRRGASVMPPTSR